VDVEALVEPLIREHGLEPVEAVLAREGGRKVLRITVDDAAGVDLERLARLSEAISRRLDAEGFDPGGAYGLEVSSPGIERPLRRPEHFARYIGSRVKVKTAAPLDGARSHTGTLLASDDSGIVLEVDGRERAILFADVASARTLADWDAELKRSNA
jgi:ribosome maturation factor RimP